MASFVGRVVGVPAAVFFGILLLGMFLIRNYYGRGGLPVFAMFVLLACIGACMSAAVMFPEID